MNDNSKVSGAKQIIIGVSVLIAGLAFICAALWLIWSGLTSLSQQVAATLITASVTALVSVFGIVESKRREQRREIEQEHRMQKVPIYEDFMSFWFRLLLANQLSAAEALDKNPQAIKRGGRDASAAIGQAEMVSFLVNFTQKIIIWGSDDVVRDYANFRRRVATPDTSVIPDDIGSTIQSLLTFEKLLLAIRSDVGHRNKGLKQGDLLSLFVNDIDRLLAASAMSKR